MSVPLLSKILPKIAKKIGARVVVEPKYGYVGQILFKNGKKKYFRVSTLDINTVGSADIAKDKGYAKFFMEKMGYTVARGGTFFRDDFAKAIGSKDTKTRAWTYAKKLGFPVIVKPNSRSQGFGVVKVTNQKIFNRAVKAIFKEDRVMLVEEALSGRDYRIVVLDNKVISAYERLPLTVVGDGENTIKTLLKRLQKEFEKTGRDTVIKMDDPRMREVLARTKKTFTSIPKNGERVLLLDNANLSTGGHAVDVTEKLHSSVQKLAIQLTKDMGLRLCGVDLMLSDNASENLLNQKYWVLEVNAAPGLDHYFETGKKQQKIVEAMYLEVLKAMEEGD
jgi:D-alanine-D-alanine ligase-like ATP-grasp enzyme